MNNIQKYIDEKYISVQKHPAADLYIYNYTQKAQFDRVWTEETMMCRGLIMDGNGNIVARPFKKFFNLEEHADLPVEPFRVYEKLDGSLGILYWIGDTPYLATRGSFVSDQAIRGTQILNKYSMYFDELNKNYTYLFEIIYPENRIVVDYEGREDIILLAVIDTATGEDLDLHECCSGFPFVSTLDGITDLSKIKEREEKNKEGFVIRFESGLRVKIKFDEYVRLHRLITGINARHIWENLKEGKGIEELIDKVPDEFYQWVKKTATKLQEEYSVIELNCSHIAKLAQSFDTRKEQAEFILRYKNTGVIFQMLDGKDYSQAIWKIIKPRYEVPFKIEI